DMRLALVVDAHRDRALQPDDPRMIGLDAAVEDADPHALAGGAAPGPVARYPLGPVDADRDLGARVGGQAPGGKALPVAPGGLLRRHAPDRTACSVGDAAAELVEQRARRLDALGEQRSLEVRDARRTELRVGLGARNDSVELAAGLRQLSSGAYPGVWRRRKHPDQAGEMLDVIVGAHHVTCSLDAASGRFLPSN